jgi:hypothetical protein
VRSFQIFTLSLVISLSVSCKKSDSDESSDSDAVSHILESAVTEASGQATASEGASGPSLMSYDPELLDLASMDYVDPQMAMNPQAACTFSAARSTCSSNVSTINWNGCSVGAATLTGGWTESWSSCANGATPGALASGANVTRTAASGQILTLASGATLTTSTTAHSAYDGTSIPGTGIQVSNTSGTRTVVINGMRKVLVGPRGRTVFDHSITSSGLTVTGTRAGGNRVVSGNSTTFHNLAQYKAVHTFNNVTWGSSTCCYPTSGTITSVLTGSLSGTISLAFAATCGSATFTGTDSTTSTVTLSQCN